MKQGFVSFQMFNFVAEIYYCSFLFSSNIVVAHCYVVITSESILMSKYKAESINYKQLIAGRFGHQAFVNCIQNCMITVLFYFNFCMQKEAQDLQVPSGRVKQFRCAFFNFSGGAEQTGAWSYRGVETVIINETQVQCTSSHLTSFVVLVMTVPAATQPVSACMLVQHRPQDVIIGHPLTLTLLLQPQPQLDSIIYIGCVIAFLCLLACIIFYVIFVR